jgi:aspartyl protease
MQVVFKYARGLRCFAVLLLCFQAVSAWSAPVSEIPFKFRAGLIWIQVDNPRGGKPLNFILDSGAEASVIDLQTARRLHLEMGQPVTVRGVNTTTEGYWPEYLPARIGGTSLPTKYLAMDLSAVSDACHRKADGLIGADFFAGRVVQIDFAKEKIRLLEDFKPEVNAEVLPLQIEAARLRAPVEVVGLGKAWARLDTGCASALHWAVSAIEPAGEGSSQEVAVGVSSILIRENTKSVRLGNLTLNDISTGLHTEKLLAGEAGLLGTGLLSQFSVVTIDEPGGHLVLDGLVSHTKPRAAVSRK